MKDSPLPHFFELGLDELSSVLSDMGEKPYRAKQIWSWAYKRFASSFDEMTDLPLALRQKLADAIVMRRLEPLLVQEGTDSWAKKYLWGFRGTPLAESVVMKYSYGSSACLSTQAGCPAGCAFCASRIIGFERNLSKGEILEQFLGMCRDGNERIGHLVFMGTGEPFLNYDAVIGAIDTLAMEDGYGLSRRKVTVSTVGVPQAMRRFAKDSGGARLALSLHAATDEVRDRIVPWNKRHPIGEVMAALRAYAKDTGQRVTVEYMLLRGINDSSEDASKLAGLLSDIDCLVNLIPWNPVPGLLFQRPERFRVEKFQEVLLGNRVKVTVRRSLGGDIEAACGQLRRQETKTEI